MTKLNRDKTSYEREMEVTIQALRQRNAELEADSTRYRNLASLVEFGSWSVAWLEVVDSYGKTVDHYMADKSNMDKRLDKELKLEDKPENDSFTITKSSYFAMENQILAQQLTIEKVWDALDKIKCYSSAAGHNAYYIIADEALSLQPSTAELEVHDEAVRVEERKKFELTDGAVQEGLTITLDYRRGAVHHRNCKLFSLAELATGMIEHHVKYTSTRLWRELVDILRGS